MAFNYTASLNSSRYITLGGRTYGACYNFKASKGTTYTFTSNCSIDVVAALYVDGSQVKYDDDGGTNRNFKLTWTASSSGDAWLYIGWYSTKTTTSVPFTSTTSLISKTLQTPPSKVTLTSLRVTPNPLIGVKGASYRLSVSTTPSIPYLSEHLSFVSLNPTIATVAADGTVTIVGAGKAIIRTTATAANTISSEITVYTAPYDFVQDEGKLKYYSSEWNNLDSSDSSR